MEAMQKYYEDRLAQMQATIEELTQQRDTILMDLAAAEEHKHTTVGLAAHTDLVERLESTERQLRDMRGKHSDLERIADVKAKMSAEVFRGGGRHCALGALPRPLRPHVPVWPGAMVLHAISLFAPSRPAP
jgi:hypothetical protein